MDSFTTLGHKHLVVCNLLLTLPTSVDNNIMTLFYVQCAQGLTIKKILNLYLSSSFVFSTPSMTFNLFLQLRVEGVSNSKSNPRPSQRISQSSIISQVKHSYVVLREDDKPTGGGNGTLLLGFRERKEKMRRGCKEPNSKDTRWFLMKSA